MASKARCVTCDDCYFPQDEPVRPAPLGTLPHLPADAQGPDGAPAAAPPDRSRAGRRRLTTSAVPHPASSRVRPAPSATRPRSRSAPAVLVAGRCRHGLRFRRRNDLKRPSVDDGGARADVPEQPIAVRREAQPRGALSPQAGRCNGRCGWRCRAHGRSSARSASGRRCRPTCHRSSRHVGRGARPCARPARAGRRSRRAGGDGAGSRTPAPSSGEVARRRVLDQVQPAPVRGDRVERERALQDHHAPHAHPNRVDDGEPRTRGQERAVRILGEHEPRTVSADAAGVVVPRDGGIPQRPRMEPNRSTSPCAGRSRRLQSRPARARRRTAAHPR